MPGLFEVDDGEADPASSSSLPPPGRLRKRLHAVDALSKLLLARIVRTTAWAVMRLLSSIAVWNVVRVCWRPVTASVIGLFISRWKLRPRVVRLLLKLGMAWTYSMYGVVRSTVRLFTVGVVVGKTLGNARLAVMGSVGVG
jgi:hypothetical protein